MKYFLLLLLLWAAAMLLTIYFSFNARTGSADAAYCEILCSGCEYPELERQGCHSCPVRREFRL